MSDEITFYDLPGHCERNERISGFALNPWKIRLAMNYKKVPYKTVFLEHPDFGPTLRQLGCPPNPPGSFAEYTSPVIQLPDGRFVAESVNVADTLEARYPTPSLHLNRILDQQIQGAVDNAFFATGADGLLTLAREMLSERSAAQFAEHRKQRWGISLGEFSAKNGGEQMWEKARAPGGVLEKLKDELTKHKKDDGPFVLGSQPSYCDFIVGGFFECYARVSKESYEKLVSFDGSFRRLHEACSPWLQRDD